MATFIYKSVKGRGSTIEAPDRATALRELMRRGETPTSLAESGESANGRAHSATGNTAPIGGVASSTGAAGAGTVRGLLGRRNMSLPEMATFIREQATALSAGLPLIQALKTQARQGRSVHQQAMLQSIIEQVEHGKSFADAAEAWGKPFDELTINMIRAGEMSGRMAEVMTQAADLLDKDLKLRRTIQSATIYPIMLLVMVVLAVVIVTTVIVPRILKQLGGSVRLPWPTRVVQGFADFTLNYWWLMILAAVGLGFAFVSWRKTPEGRLWLDRNLLGVPALGRLLRDVAVARFTRTLGTLIGAGLPVLTALRLSKGTLGNRAMEVEMDDVITRVAAGRTIADVMERSGYFPPMLVQIVNLGERTGRLDELLTRAAGSFEDRTEMSVKVFTAILPPVLVIGLAIVVGFVVMAVILALMSVQESVGGI